MYGTDPYLAERTMAHNVRASRTEAQRLGDLSLSGSARRLALRLSPLLVTLGGRLVHAGLPPYRGAVGGLASERQDVPARTRAA